MESRFILTILLISLCAYPAESMSRWFSATFNDLKFTLYRYGHCYSGLQPLSGPKLNEAEYLIHQIRVFLDQGNYDNEQLANVSALMDNICRPNIDTSYPISVHIDVNKFGNNYLGGKENRCNAIDDALDSMYYVFKRAAVNHSEPLDFSVIQFYPNETDRTATYNLTDLINTSWIKSETILEHVCSITNATKDYVESRSRNSSAQARLEPGSQAGLFSSLFDYLNRLLDPILGLQKRLYWEGANRFGQLSSRVGTGLGSIRDGIGSGVGRTRQRLFGSRSNSTSSLQASNSTFVASNSTAGSFFGLANNGLNTTTTNSSSMLSLSTPTPIVKSLSSTGSTSSQSANKLNASALMTNALN